MTDHGPSMTDAAYREMADKGARHALVGDRYLPRGGVRHRTHSNTFQTSVLVAACGISADSYDWRGTGTQDEYIRLARIPRCTRCMAAEESS